MSWPRSATSLATSRQRACGCRSECSGPHWQCSSDQNASSTKVTVLNEPIRAVESPITTSCRCTEVASMPGPSSGASNGAARTPPAVSDEAHGSVGNQHGLAEVSRGDEHDIEV